jgi:hypothetical protein
LKLLLLRDACNKILQPIRQKVIAKQEKYVQKLAAKGGSLEEVQEQSKGKEAIYEGAFGQFLESSQVTRYVQKHIFKHSVVSEDEVSLFNLLHKELKNAEKQVK